MIEQFIITLICACLVLFAYRLGLKDGQKVGKNILIGEKVEKYTPTQEELEQKEWLDAINNYGGSQ